MSKQRGKTRHAIRIINAGARLNRVGEQTVSFELPDKPGNFLIFTKDEHPEQVGRTTPEGLFLWCKGCRCEHILLWDDENYNQAQELVQRPGGPVFYNILCIDGRVQIAMPGERYEGRVTCLQKVMQTITGNRDNKG